MAKNYKAEISRFRCVRCDRLSTYFLSDKEAEKAAKHKGWKPLQSRSQFSKDLVLCPICSKGGLR